MRKSLSLKRESLAALSTDELGAVAAGQQALLTHATCGTCGLTDTCGHGLSCVSPCPTIPVNPCVSLGDKACIQLDYRPRGPAPPGTGPLSFPPSGDPRCAAPA